MTMALRYDSGWRAKLVQSYPDLFHPDGDPIATEAGTHLPEKDSAWPPSRRNHETSCEL
jgi:hypothetical protein